MLSTLHAHGRSSYVLALGLFVLLGSLLWTPRSWAAGFDSPYQSARAMALGGTGVASEADVSAMFYNPGALAFAQQHTLAAGVTVSAVGELLYQGLRPGPGSGTSSEQADNVTPAPHVFMSKALGKVAALGIGVYSPFSLRSEWTSPAEYAGRFVSVDGELEAYDANPTFAVQLSPSLGLGVGVIYRSSSLQETRRLPLTFAGQRLDVATLAIDTSYDDGYGWTAGLFLRTGDRLRWGVAYRSAIEIEYDGEGRLTQLATGNSQVDALVAASLPIGVDLPVASRIELPDRLTAGLSFGLGKAATVALEAERTGWSSVQSIPFAFPGQPDLSFVLPLELEDAQAYRVGFGYLAPSHWEWRFGYAYEETPQPSATVGPFLADADRHSLSFGVGRDWLHLALLYRQSVDRTVLDNVDEINGRYRASAWLLALTVTH